QRSKMAGATRRQRQRVRKKQWKPQWRRHSQIETLPSAVATLSSWRTPARLLCGGLGILQMIEQLLGLRIIWRQLHSLFRFRARELGFLLLEINLRQHRAYFRGISRRKRHLQFLHGVVHLSLV